jgi:hypothetical protein
MVMETTVCKNPWCKATFFYKEEEKVTSEDGVISPPPICSKCKSFDSELSGGVTWKDKKYDGSRFDGTSHQTAIKINKYI